MMKTNKKLGNLFENEFCELLSKKGFWVHLLAQNKSGQPADVIAIKSGMAYLIDCKVCSRHSFSLSRVEDNQQTAMEYWSDCDNGVGWFAIKMNEEILMLSYDTINELSNRMSSLNDEQLRRFGISLERWLETRE